MHGLDTGWGFGMGLGMWVFWIVLIIVIVALFKVITPGSGQSSGDKSPIEILKARYARGEIDEEEYKRRLSELEKS